MNKLEKASKLGEELKQKAAKVIAYEMDKEIYDVLTANKKVEKLKKKYTFEVYDDLEKFFKKIDKIWQKEFGKECPEFCLNCAQCKFALIYNKFKQDVFDEVLK